MEEKGLEKKQEIIAKVSKKVEKEHHNKIIRNFFIFFIMVAVALVVWILVSKDQSELEYKGVKFDIVDEIAKYRTLVQVNSKNTMTGEVTMGQPYYFYLRTNPKELEKIPFEGKIVFIDEVIIKTGEDFTCEGDGTIGLANLIKLYDLFGINIVKNENIECETSNSIVWQMQGGEETRIDQLGPSCYSITIKDCEILKATEKLMVETLAQFNKLS